MLAPADADCQYLWHEHGCAALCTWQPQLLDCHGILMAFWCCRWCISAGKMDLIKKAPDGAFFIRQDSLSNQCQIILQMTGWMIFSIFSDTFLKCSLYFQVFGATIAPIPPKTKITIFKLEPNQPTRGKPYCC